MAPDELRKAIETALDDAKALEPEVLDVRALTDIADYMIVASGTSTRHVSAIADKIVDALRPSEVRPIGVEGKRQGEWVLIDFGDVIVHIMHPQTRSFYNLEMLWSSELAPEVQSAAKPRRRPRG